MNGAKSYVIRALLGAALASGGLPGLAAAFPPPPTPTPTPSPTPTPTPTPRYELSVDSGKVTDVGVVPTPGVQGNSTVKLTGGFVFDGPIDFASSSVTIRALLDETAGAGELFKGFQGQSVLPTVLFRKSGNDDNVVFTSPDSARPSFRLALHRKENGVYQANLKISRATVPSDPTKCTGSPSTTLLDAVFVLDDGHNAPVTVAGIIEWVCVLDKDKLRIATGDEQPPPGNDGAPKASVRTNLLTRNTGQPSLVLLDGSSSSDSDGTIVSYTFSVTQKPSGAVVFGPSTGASSAITTTLPPGNYTAVLVVTDNLGNPSSPGTRSFSIK